MRSLVLIGALVVLAACSRNETDTFFCVGGPDLAVNYQEDSATILLNDGRQFTLPEVEEGLYAQPGIVWQEVDFRTARLTDGQRSFNCDQSSL